jgi:D-alanine-D-alanine ligase-like ATP-grasp enzyme
MTQYLELSASLQNSDLVRELIAEEVNRFDVGASTPPLSPEALIKGQLRGKSYHLKTITDSVFEISNDTDRVIFENNAPDIFPALTKLSSNLQIARNTLASAKLPLPVGRFFADEEKALEYFLSRKTPQSVKPQNYNTFGRQTDGIESADAFRAAWKKSYLAGRLVLVEDTVLGHALRVFIVDGKAEAAFVLLPAHIVGDGQKTVAELIADKDAERANNPLLKSYKIKASSPIGRAGYSPTDVPELGEHVFLSRSAALEAGAEVISLRDKLHPSLIALAESTAKAIPNATFLSISITAKDLQKDALSPTFLSYGDDNNAVVMGIDCNAPIAMACFPSYGTVEQDFVNKLVDAALKAAAQARRMKERITTATIAPADTYYAPCNGQSFQRNYSTQRRLIRQAAYSRNLRVQSVSSDITIVSDGSNTATFMDGMPHLTRVICRTATNDKEWTKNLLRDADLRTPAGGMFDASAKEDAWAFARALQMPVVVKPKFGSGGRGVATDITTEEHFLQAWDAAAQTKAGKILVEEFYSGNDYRVFVVGKEVRAVSQRLPAYVVGDGTHTVNELIDLKNVQRSTNPHDGSKLMKLTPMMLRHIASFGFTKDSVLEADYYLQLHKVANIGSGGESRDLSADIHPDWAEIGARVRRAVFDPMHVGFDLIAEDIKLSPHHQRWVILEVNSNPDMGIHHFITHGEPRNSSVALIDALFPATKLEVQKKAVKVQLNTVREQQDILYSVWRAAHLRSLTGTIEKQGQNYEAVFAGPSRAVDDMVEQFLSRAGTKRGNVEVTDYHGDLPFGFEMR